MSPALLAFALIHYAVNPAYQIAHRLSPLIIAALVAVVVNLLIVTLAPERADASVFALAQSASSLAGLAALLAMLFWLQPVWPRGRDVAGIMTSPASCSRRPIRCGTLRRARP